MVSKTSDQNENYKACAISLILIGVLLLIDRLIGFSSFGADWVMRRANFLLYIGVVFFLIKKDKTIGVALAGIWVLLNMGKVFALLGSLSDYLLPLGLLVGGVVLYGMSRRK